MSEERNNPNPEHDPPHWLRVSDESWGPADLRKRTSRPFYRPSLPRIGRRNPPNKVLIGVLILLAVLCIVAGILAGIR